MNEDLKIYTALANSDATHHYKKKNLEFDYLTKKEFKKLCEDNEAINVVGSIKLSKQTNNQNESCVLVKSNDCEFRFKLFENAGKGFVKGYLKVSDTEYIEIKSFVFIPLILLFAVLLLSAILAFALFNKPSDDNNSLSIASSKDWDKNLPANGDSDSQQASTESISIPGYSDLYVSADNPSIELINPDNNTVYMVYTVSYKDKVIYETDGVIPAGKMVDANFYELFNKKQGAYDVVFQISTYDVETNAPCNGATQHVTINVK